jgi:hypothetical protein
MAERRLKSAEDVRRLLASLIREMSSGELDAVKGGRIAYVASILIRCIETSTVEQRLDALETELGGRRR